MTTTEYPRKTIKTVPVSCDVCGKDEEAVTVWKDKDHRSFSLRCPHCRRIDVVEFLQRLHLNAWVSGKYTYVGSYWGYDDGVPQPARPTMNLLEPESRTIIDSIRNWWNRG